MPDLDRILQMSRVFGVTTDYLVKDELEGTGIHKRRRGNAAARPACLA